MQKQTHLARKRKRRKQVVELKRKIAIGTKCRSSWTYFLWKNWTECWLNVPTQLQFWFSLRDQWKWPMYGEARSESSHWIHFLTRSGSANQINHPSGQYINKAFASNFENEVLSCHPNANKLLDCKFWSSGSSQFNVRNSPSKVIISCTCGLISGTNAFQLHWGFKT